jgi:hypothetical protein
MFYWLVGSDIHGAGWANIHDEQITTGSRGEAAVRNDGNILRYPWPPAQGLAHSCQSNSALDATFAWLVSQTLLGMCTTALHCTADPLLPLPFLSPSFSMDNTGVQYVRASPRWSSIFCVAGLLRGMKTDQRRTRTKSVVSEDGLYGAFFEFFFLKPIILKF